MVEAIRETEKLIGDINYTLTEKQKASRAFCRSLYVVSDIKKESTLLKKTSNQ